MLSSISGQPHEFIIYAMRRRARADNLTVFYRKKQMDVSFSCVCPVIDNEFRHNIVKVMIMNLYSAKTIEEYSKVLYIELKLMNKGKFI